MLDFLTVVFDPYDRKARIQPALLSVVPVFVACLLLIPQLGAMWTTVGGVILYCGSTMLLAQLGRDRGKKLEPMLFDAWGGKPSVAMLRHRDTRLAKHTKDRYRAFLTANIPGLELASPEVEQQSPTLADDAYGSATSWLLTQTRDGAQFGLLFKENINYGFRRNTWALRPWAFGADMVAIALLSFMEADAWTGEFASTLRAVGSPAWTCVAITVAHGLLFSFRIRPDWVKVAAEAYAYQLLAACDTLAVGGAASNAGLPEGEGAATV